MKKILLIISSFLFMINVFGQKTEFGISLNSGLFSFSGASTESTSSINYTDPTSTIYTNTSSYTNNPYGSKNGPVYGASFKVERVTIKNFILGFDLGYELLKSKVSIDGIDGADGYGAYHLVATGETYLANKFINLNPFIGYRLMLNEISFDLAAGFDIGHRLGAYEDGNATDSDGKKYTTSRNRNSESVKNDFRPRIQISNNYKKVGIYLGYSFGLTSYLPNYWGPTTDDCYSRIIRFGISYRIK